MMAVYGLGKNNKEIFLIWMWDVNIQKVSLPF